MRTTLIVFFLFCFMVSLGCTESGSSGGVPVVVKEKKPDIRVTSQNLEKSFSLSEGAIAKGTYTLTNYGDADGYATITCSGDVSGTLNQETVYVPMQNSVTKQVRLDISNKDNTISIRVIKQTKA